MQRIVKVTGTVGGTWDLMREKEIVRREKHTIVRENK